MRQPLVDPTARPDVAALVDRIAAVRWGRVSALYGMLLHSPAVAEGWMGLGSAIRRGTGLPDRQRELAICLVARIMEQSFELAAHAPIARAAGATDEELTHLLDRNGCTSFDEDDRALLELVEATARGVVDDAIFQRAARRFDPEQLVEIVATASYYLGTARFLSAFGIEDGAPDLRTPPPGGNEPSPGAEQRG